MISVKSVFFLEFCPNLSGIFIIGNTFNDITCTVLLAVYGYGVVRGCTVLPDNNRCFV